MHGGLVGAVVAVAFSGSGGEERGGLDGLGCVEGVEGCEVGGGEGGGEDGVCGGDFRVGAFAFD